MATHANATPLRHQGRPTGLMDLAVEIRLQIYGYVFAPLHERRCLYSIRRTEDDNTDISEDQTEQKHPVRPSTCLLRTNKQIYRESQPVLWESAEYRALGPDWPMEAWLDKASSSLRSIVLSTAVPNSRTRLSMVPELSSYAPLMQVGLPQLRELRIHVDWFPASTADFHSLATRLAEGLKSFLLSEGHPLVIFVDVHGTCLRFDSEGSRRVKVMQRETVRVLREELEGVRQGLRVEEWS